MVSVPSDWHKTVEINDRIAWPIFLDYLEEQGDSQRVLGYRALLRLGLRPIEDMEIRGEPIAYRAEKREEKWYWFVVPNNSFMKFPWMLPRKWFNRLTVNFIHNSEFSSKFEALDTAALAYREGDEQ